MKKISIIAALAALIMLVSCSGASSEDTSKADETTVDMETSNDTALEETTPFGENGEGVDFETVEVKGFLFAAVGEDPLYYAEGCDVYVSSKPSVATVDGEGKIIPVSEGVTLIGYGIGDQTEAIAVCVFPEGEGPDRSAGESASVFEAGQTFMHTAPVGGVEYSSSNEKVVDVSNAPNLSFKESGYACITCASASRPFFYNFIVYDRTVE